MYGAEESYHRPRFRGADDIVSLLAAGTAGTVGTINRTGEQLAESYGQMPRLLGAGVKNFTESYRNAEERLRQREIEDEAREMQQESHEQRMSLGRQAEERGTIELDELKNEQGYWNTPYGPAGGMGPVLPDKGMSRRDVQRSQQMRMGELGVTQAEEGIASTKAQRENAARALELQEKTLGISAGAARRQQQLLDLELQRARDADASAALGAALSQAPVQMPEGQQGPLPPSQLEAVKQQLRARGMDEIKINTLLTQAQAQHAQNQQQQSLLRRRIDPGYATAQDQLTSIQNRLPALDSLVSSAQKYSTIPLEQDMSQDAQVALQGVKSGLQAASFDPATGERLAQGVGNSFDFDPLRGASDFFRGRDTGGFIQTGPEQAKQAVQNVLASYEAQVANLASQAQISGDPQLMQQATMLKARIDSYKQLLGAGAVPGSHNNWQPNPQGGGFFAPRGGGMPQGAPQMANDEPAMMPQNVGGGRRSQ